ncbi:UNVERIFIED_CONTAM: hypothetical protein K2H54_047702 [Gekko kuhli]
MASSVLTQEHLQLPTVGGKENGIGQPYYSAAHDITVQLLAVSFQHKFVWSVIVTLFISELCASQRGMAGDETPPPLPPHPSDELLMDYNHSSVADSAAYSPDQHINFRPLTLAKQTESINLKASKSMDLVVQTLGLELLPPSVKV